MLILGIDKFFTQVDAGIYRTLARVYDIILDFSNGIGLNIVTNPLKEIQTTLYTLFGVFMTFRIAISLLNYLIDPDKISDKSVGTGKLITKIFLSIVLLMTLNSFIFPLMYKLQNALLDSDSIIYNIFPTNKESANEVGAKSSVLYEDVNALNENETLTCYYSYVYMRFPYIESGQTGSDPGYKMNGEATSVMYSYLTALDFYVCNIGTGTSGVGGGISGGTSSSVDKTSICVKTSNSSSNEFTLVFDDYELSNNLKEKILNDNSCPKGVSFSSFTNTYGSDNETLTKVDVTKLIFKNSDSHLVAGSSSLAETKEESKETYEDLTDTLGSYTEEEAKALGISYTGNYNKKIKYQESAEFAINMLNSFSEDPIDVKFLTDANETKKVANKVDNGEILLSTFMALIGGIIAIVFLFVICIEVVVRNIKLVFLEIISPIPVMSYMNPNDKVFESWLKQYTSTFASLFIQLLILKAGVFFMNTINFGSTFYSLLTYYGVFLFMKSAPGMIQKMFGLDASSGTFKDSFGLVKTGLGIGAGAVAGGVAGAITGMGSGMGISTIAGGLIGGAFRGAQGGASGKYLEGAQKQISKNKAAKMSNLNGGNWYQRTLSKIGMDSASRMDRSKRMVDLRNYEKAYEDFNKYKSSIDSVAESSNFYKDLSSMVDASGNKLFSTSELKKARAAFIETQISGSPNTITLTDRNGNTLTETIAIEGGKKSAIDATLRSAEIHRKNSDTIKDVAGTSAITSYASLDAADTAVSNAKNDVHNEILDITTSASYQAGAASRDSSNNK